MKLQSIIIGAGRSGTTSLVEYVKQHPNINFSTIKEVSYFSIDDHFNRGEKYLNAFFENKKGRTCTSDTYLLMDKNAPLRIKKYNPSIKLIVVIREPSQRTFSNFQYAINNGYIDEKTSFIESESLESNYLKNNDIVFQNNYCNFYGSLYHKHLSYWLNYFNKEQLFICTTNELNTKPVETLNKLFDFIGITKLDVTPLQIKNKASGVKLKGLNSFLIDRNNWLRKLIRKPLQINLIRKIIFKTSLVEKIKDINRTEKKYREMTPEEIEFCSCYFKNDLELLKKEFGIEFSS